MSNRYQITFNMGSGPDGEQVAALLENQKQRLRVDSDAKLLRIALRIVSKLSLNDKNVKAAIAEEK